MSDRPLLPVPPGTCTECCNTPLCPDGHKYRPECRACNGSGRAPESEEVGERLGMIRVTHTYADSSWPARTWMQRGDTEGSLKARRRRNGSPFDRQGPGWAEKDHPSAWTALGVIPARTERIEWLGESPTEPTQEAERG